MSPWSLDLSREAHDEATGVIYQHTISLTITGYGFRAATAPHQALYNQKTDASTSIASRQGLINSPPYTVEESKL